MPKLFEDYAARLVPFDLTFGGLNGGPLAPLASSGLVFPYTPSINEEIKINYDKYDLVHSNESYHAYKSTENRRITISNAVFTCDTEANARYALAALHFLWSYSLMDFGKGKTGRPPAPMWFSAYGNYAFNQVPVLMESISIQWPDNKDTDYVPVADAAPSTSSAVLSGFGFNQPATGALSDTGSYTWLPMKFEVSSIGLVVQHSPRYWKNDFTLEDYRSGAMASRDGADRAVGIAGSGGLLNQFAGGNLGQIIQNAGATADQFLAGVGGGLSGSLFSADAVAGSTVSIAQGELESTLQQIRGVGGDFGAGLFG